ncbi:MAG TPA: hypothetical protein VLA56_20790 [Pseudomonadales bacterium]|nr:hypothetical protein [Pseudomonadales bacterium]
MNELQDDLLDAVSTAPAAEVETPAPRCDTSEMRAVLRHELVDLTRQLSRLETVLDDVGAESPAQRRARARASLLAILDRLS